MLVLVNLPYYCSGANLGRYTNIQTKEKCMYVCQYAVFEQGGWGEGGWAEALAKGTMSSFTFTLHAGDT